MSNSSIQKINPFSTPTSVYRIPNSNTSFLNKEDHDLTPYTLIPYSSAFNLPPTPVTTILNNIFYTISNRGFIKHSLELESSLMLNNQVTTSPFPGKFQCFFRSPYSYAEVDQYSLFITFTCNGVYSYVIAYETYSVSGQSHYLVLIPPVTITKYNYKKELVSKYTANTNYKINSDDYVILKVSEHDQYVMIDCSSVAYDQIAKIEVMS